MAIAIVFANGISSATPALITLNFLTIRYQPMAKPRRIFPALHILYGGEQIFRLTVPDGTERPVALAPPPEIEDEPVPLPIPGRKAAPSGPVPRQRYEKIEEILAQLVRQGQESGA